MPEELEEQSTAQFDLGRYLDIVRRRHICFLILLLVGWAIVWGMSWLPAPRYTSSTLILIQPPSMPKNYVVPNVSDDVQQQIQSFTQQITSRTRLLRIIDKFHLYGNSSSPEQKVKAMLKDVDVELVQGPQGQSANAFRVSYTAQDPHLAQQVTSELTNLVIDENLATRQQESQDTTQFLEGQLQAARSSLAQQAAKVQFFQAEHQGSLPSQEASNLQGLSSLQSQLQNEQDALYALRHERVYYQSMVDHYQSLPDTPRAANGAPAQLTAIDQQLETLKSKLMDLSGRYTDQYPEVQQVKSEIAKTEKTREQIIATLRNRANTKSHAPGDLPSALADPSLSASGLQMQSQLKADEPEIANRERAITDLKSRIAQYQARLSEEPDVAQQLADMTSSYNQSQDNYNQLLQRVSSSQMATAMEQMQKGNGFTIVDPASLPLLPDPPHRMKKFGMGLAAGLGLGIIVVGLLEFFDDRLHSDKDIEELLPTSVISEIPEVLSPAEEKRMRRKLILGWAMAATVTVIILVGAAFSYLTA